jgi:hypothetical protein
MTGGKILLSVHTNNCETFFYTSFTSATQEAAIRVAWYFQANGHGTQLAIHMALYAGNTYRLHCLDCYSRRSVSGTAGVLREMQQGRPHSIYAKVLLPIYL